MQRLASLCDSVPAQQRSSTRQSPNVTKREPTRQPHKNKNSRPQTSKVGPKMTPTKPQEYAGKTENDGIHRSEFERNTDNYRDTSKPQKSMNRHVVIHDKAETDAKTISFQNDFSENCMKVKTDVENCRLLEHPPLCKALSKCLHSSQSKCQECRHQRVRFKFLRMHRDVRDHWLLMQGTEVQNKCVPEKIVKKYQICSSRNQRDTLRISWNVVC